ncbi:hypothetical protein BAE44_0019786 [Dichanthelium oligosanthes]|uniref:Uncharacterized protein n=1 Tax=Dichanthelium oligosanthes TaxID=888268 RepID=A0A1E5V2F6_9POAL|nr:hypothetical protein BAE44_0019786 [Dichanthelium oligosanthes]
MERVRADDDALLARTGLIVLTLTSAESAYRAAAAGDVGSTAFVAVSYSTLLLLSRRLRAYERLRPGGEADQMARLRREVWALCTLLTVLFAWKVAAAMPSWPVAAAVWSMAALTTAGGYIALFHCP